jgi:apolipoprotein D and lipocalin family protein
MELGGTSKNLELGNGGPQPSREMRVETQPSALDCQMIRIHHLSLLAALMSSCSMAKPDAGAPLLKTVAAVDLERYSGKWFELARFPQWFQKDCASATADYSKNADGTIRVVNTCIRKDGTERSVTGIATPVDASANRLRVRFSEVWAAKLIPVPAEGNYWVIDITPGYQQAIVGTPDRKSLWFLSRSPTISTASFEKLKKTAESQGFDTGRLVIDAHTRLTP